MEPIHCESEGSSSFRKQASGCPKEVVVDSRDTRYHVVRVAAQNLGWTCHDGDREDVPPQYHGKPCRSAPDSTAHGAAQIIWRDKSVTLEVVKALTHYQRINHFVGMHVIARKAVLFKRIMKLLRKQLRSSSQSDRGTSDGETKRLLEQAVSLYFPESFSSTSDVSLLQQHCDAAKGVGGSQQGCRATYYIIKPNTGCEGKGIRLSRRPLETLHEIQDQEECIVQVYVDRPLLLEGKKFDLRIYVLLTSVCPPPKPRPAFRRPSQPQCGGAAEVHPLPTAKEDKSLLHGVQLLVHRRGLVRVCALPYKTPSEDNCGTRGIHLTNYAVNKELEEFEVSPVSGGATDTGNKRDLLFLPDFINNIPESELDTEAMAQLAARYGHPGGSRWDLVQKSIDECIALTMLSGVETLRREYNAAVNRSRASVDVGCTACFELLGFDIMLEGCTLRPVLMEVNHSPSLFCETDFDFDLKECILEDTLRVIEAKTPGHSDCPSKPRYEKAMKHLAQSTEAVPGVDGTGWRVLLPHHPNPGEKEAVWTAADKAKQELILKLCSTL